MYPSPSPFHPSPARLTQGSEWDITDHARYFQGVLSVSFPRVIPLSTAINLGRRVPFLPLHPPPFPPPAPGNTPIQPFTCTPCARPVSFMPCNGLHCNFILLHPLVPLAVQGGGGLTKSWVWDNTVAEAFVENTIAPMILLSR